jgi:hypothetical protein
VGEEVTLTFTAWVRIPDAGLLGNRTFCKKQQLDVPAEDLLDWAQHTLDLDWPYPTMAVLAVEHDYISQQCTIQLEHVRVGSPQQLQQLLAGAAQHGWVSPDLTQELTSAPDPSP